MSSVLMPCPRCASPCLSEQPSCPHCGGVLAAETSVQPTTLAVLGLLLAGCPGKRRPDPEPQVEYGMPIVDMDTDGKEDAEKPPPRDEPPEPQPMYGIPPTEMP